MYAICSCGIYLILPLTAPIKLAKLLEFNEHQQLSLYKTHQNSCNIQNIWHMLVFTPDSLQCEIFLPQSVQQIAFEAKSIGSTHSTGQYANDSHTAR
jgi:hypothetical protein